MGLSTLKDSVSNPKEPFTYSDNRVDTEAQLLPQERDGLAQGLWPKDQGLGVKHILLPSANLQRPLL